ncbi:ATP-grasp domain-containing protein [Kribbella sancticallisti]|uniref:ATP-grasp domain-containing protein n=1 Tax=Kribbella sancticallisti TaxID=460087 RepID=A0ABP4QRM9_9ACTN
MTTVMLNRHVLRWAAGAGGQYLPGPPSHRSLVTRTFGGGLDGFDPSAFPDVVVCDMLDPARLEAVVAWVATTRSAGHIVALHEKDLLLAARVRAVLGLPGPTEAETLPFRDKITMKDRLVAAGYTALPRYLPLSAFTSVDELPWRGTRLVVKARRGLGASEVRVLPWSNSAVAAAVTDLRLSPADGEIEEFIEGPMYHCDSVVEDGRIIFVSASRYLRNPGSFGTSDHLGTVTLRPTDPPRAELLEHNAAVIAGLGLQNGVTHIEFFGNDERGLVFCEAAARPGGGGIDECVQRTTGVNLVRAAVRLQAGDGALESPPKSAVDTVCGVIGLLSDEYPPELENELRRRVPGLVSYAATPAALPGGIRHATDYRHRVVISAASQEEFEEQRRTTLSAHQELSGRSRNNDAKWCGRSGS